MAEETRKISIRSEYWTAIFIGTLKFLVFACEGFNFWICAIWVENARINPCTGKVYTMG